MEEIERDCPETVKMEMHMSKANSMAILSFFDSFLFQSFSSSFFFQSQFNGIPTILDRKLIDI